LIHGEETKQQILTALHANGFDISDSQLARLHREGLIDQPVVCSLGRGRGRVSLYPVGTSARVQRICEIRCGGRLALAHAGWQLWWEDGGWISRPSRDFLEKVAKQWQHERDELKDLMDRENGGDRGAEAEMDEIYRSAELDRMPARLGILRRHTGKAKFPTVFRVFAEVIVGRFQGFEDSGGDESLELVERALGINKARVDRLADGDPWFQGSSADDLRRLSQLLGHIEPELLALATDEELDVARREISAVLQLIDSVTYVFVRIFGSTAFGFGTVRTVIHDLHPAEQAFFLLAWLSLREDPELRNGVQRLMPLIPEAVENAQLMEKASEDHLSKLGLNSSSLFQSELCKS
jgi:hypothetical protein